MDLFGFCTTHDELESKIKARVQQLIMAMTDEEVSEFADWCGVSQKTVYHWFTGNRNIPAWAYVHLKQIAAAHGKRTDLVSS